MACVSALYLPGDEVYDAQPDGYKHLGVVAFTQCIIGTEENFGRCLSGVGQTANCRFGPHHKQRRRNSLAGNIRDDERKLILFHKEDVIKVAADLFGGIHCCVDFEVMTRDCEILRQRGLLDAAGKLQFLLNTFFRRVDVSFQNVDCLVDVVGQ